MLVIDFICACYACLWLCSCSLYVVWVVACCCIVCALFRLSLCCVGGSVDPWIRGSVGLGSVDPWIRGSVDLWIRGSVGPWIRGSVDPWVRGSVRNLIRTICPNQVLGDFRAFWDTSGVDHPAEDPAGRL